MNARLVMTILTNLLYEAIIVVVLIWGLPALGMHVPLYGIILICVAFLIYAVVLYIIGGRALTKKPLSGFTTMECLEGQVVSRLAPEGTVKIGGELWSARAENGIIDVGTDVVVVRQNGLKVVVRPKQPDNSCKL
jgi:membrane protein implicated in regulation of membrane protease activity